MNAADQHPRVKISPSGSMTAADSHPRVQISLRASKTTASAVVPVPLPTFPDILARIDALEKTQSVLTKQLTALKAEI
jgi:hypothetical protein